VPAPPAGNSRSSFFVLCGLLLVTAFLFWAQKVLIPIALAVLLTFILTPAVAALQRRGLGRVPSVLVVTILVFALLWGIGWIISQQITGLLYRLPSYKGEVIRKIESLRGAGEGGVWSHLRDFVDSVTQQLVDPGAAPPEEGSSDNETSADRGGGATPRTSRDVLPGRDPNHPAYVTTASSGWSRVVELAGPAGEFLASSFLVVVLTIFMLAQRENLRNRIVRLVGHGNLVATTRAFNEGAQRISRYLLMQVFVNSTFALLLAVGLFLLGLYADPPGRPALRTTAVFWGFIAGSLRFVPYLGTWLAAVLLFIFTVATLPGWTLPLVVIGLFIVLELVTANVVEPLLFGHSTGSSPVALLLAAAFWTWLWGPVGLILSTPLTVILVVLGKYVPQLEFFEVLLGDEPALSVETTFYQRLVARDLDEASDLVEEYAQAHSTEGAFADLLLPALVQARADRDRGTLAPEGLQFIYRTLRELIDELAPASAAAKAAAPITLLGCPASEEGGDLALLILAATLRPAGYAVEVLPPTILASEVMERLANECNPVICVAALPPGGAAQARYLVKRIRAQCPAVKIAVARWGEAEELERISKRLKAAGADFVGTTLAETRSQLLPLLQLAAVNAQAAAQEVSAAH
jgi:predicted PurR-regulated permease PerM